MYLEARIPPLRTRFHLLTVATLIPFFGIPVGFGSMRGISSSRVFIRGFLATTIHPSDSLCRAAHFSIVDIDVARDADIDAHTVLFPKSDDVQKLRHVAGYRPISLCNVGYKTYAEFLTKGLQTVVSQMVGDQRTCGIHGRTVLTNVHVARSVLECCTSQASKVAMLQIDFARAFDRVSRTVLFHILEHVGSGSVITNGLDLSIQ